MNICGNFVPELHFAQSSSRTCKRSRENIFHSISTYNIATYLTCYVIAMETRFYIILMIVLISRPD